MAFSTVAYRGQKYSSIKKACFKKGELFTDPEFPANNKSLFFSKVDNEIEWKRPKELCKVPKLFIEGVTREDINQGEYGMTWFVSACSSLAQDPKIWQKVIPAHKEQEWSDLNQYAGIFHFQFWRYGQWLDVVVDDQLPTKNGKLVFCHSEDRNEFWSALLEKAYAKLYGDYESLSTGYTADALVDFTGGIAEKMQLKDMNLERDDLRTAFFKDLKDASENRALMTCSIACSKGEVGQDAQEGLIKGYGYGITDVKEINVTRSLQSTLGAPVLYMMRLRNPWGNKEWTGPWSDNSNEWSSLSGKDRDKMGIKFQQEGEFWMSFMDFLKHFSNIDICHFVNTAFFSLKKSWNESLLLGEWTLGARGGDKDRSGGNEKNDTFLFNPQFVFDVIADQDKIMVSLEQDDAGVDKKTGSEHQVIGFHIMKVEDNRIYRVHQPGLKMAESEYKKSRSIFDRIPLVKGRYVIIPSTEKPGIVGKFMLRLYTTGKSGSRALNLDCPKPPMCIGKPHQQVTVVKVVKATDLSKAAKETNTVDPYIIVKCEGETVKSNWRKDTRNPEWNFRTIFYRKKPDDVPVTVEIHNHNLMVDDFMGVANIPDRGTEKPEVKEYDLFGKKKKDLDVQMPGKLTVEITSSEDLSYL